MDGWMYIGLGMYVRGDYTIRDISFFGLMFFNPVTSILLSVYSTPHVAFLLDPSAKFFFYMQYPKPPNLYVSLIPTSFFSRHWISTEGIITSTYWIKSKDAPIKDKEVHKKVAVMEFMFQEDQTAIAKREEERREKCGAGDQLKNAL